MTMRFNPRARDGRDFTGLRHAQHGCRVSIHAPVMDAIRPNIIDIIRHCSFNPRARDGRDGFNDRYSSISV